MKANWRYSRTPQGYYSYSASAASMAARSRASRSGPSAMFATSRVNCRTISSPRKEDVLVRATPKASNAYSASRCNAISITGSRPWSTAGSRGRGAGVRRRFRRGASTRSRNVASWMINAPAVCSLASMMTPFRRRTGMSRTIASRTTGTPPSLPFPRPVMSRTSSPGALTCRSRNHASARRAASSPVEPSRRFNVRDGPKRASSKARRRLPSGGGDNGGAMRRGQDGPQDVAVELLRRLHAEHVRERRRHVDDASEVRVLPRLERRAIEQDRDPGIVVVDGSMRRRPSGFAPVPVRLERHDELRRDVIREHVEPAARDEIVDGVFLGEPFHLINSRDSGYGLHLGRKHSLDGIRT